MVIKSTEKLVPGALLVILALSARAQEVVAALAPPQAQVPELGSGQDARPAPVAAAVVAPAPTEAGKFSGRLDLLLRSYAEDIKIRGGSSLHAVVQSGRLAYQSEFYGPDAGFGVGFDAGLYGAIRLDGGLGSRNLGHRLQDGSGTGDHFWAYLGEYALKMKAGKTVIKYGLQQGLDNPYIPPFDIRSLPPTFRGISMVSNDIEGVAISAGSFNGAIARGDQYVHDLSTTYGGINFRRLSYAGVDATFGDIGLSLYGSRYADLQDQYYLSLSKGFDLGNSYRFTGKLDSYITRDSGAHLQGEIKNNAGGISGVLAKGASSVMLGYQLSDGDHFVDYTQETAGIYLPNAMGTDYNGPHEHSVQLKYVFDGNKTNFPGFKLTIFQVRGAGVDGGAAAAEHADANDPVHGLYWKNGLPISGKRFEWSIYPTYVVQDGTYKGAKISFYIYRTRVSTQYPSKSFDDMQLKVNFPLRLL